MRTLVAKGMAREVEVARALPTSSVNGLVPFTTSFIFAVGVCLVCLLLADLFLFFYITLHVALHCNQV